MTTNNNDDKNDDKKDDKNEEDFGIPPDATVAPSSSSPAVLQIIPEGGTSAIVIGNDSLVHSRRCLLVGRQAATCDIRIAQKSLSRQHGVLYYSQNNLWVKDLQTKSGTLVNQKRLSDQPVALYNNDVLQWGKVITVKVQNWKDRPATTPEEETSQAEPEKEEEEEEEEEEENETSQPPQTNKQHNDGEVNDFKPELTGRAKRKAEIAAMIASLDATPEYTKYVAKDNELSQPKSPLQPPKANPVLAKYKLPLKDATPLTSLLAEDSKSSSVSCLAMDPSGARFGLGSMDSSLKLYDFAGLDPLRPLPFHNGYICQEANYPLTGLAPSPNGDRWIVGTASSQPQLLDRDGQELLTFVRGDVYVMDPQKTSGHTAGITGVAWHPLLSSIVFTTSRDGSLRVWNVDTGKLSFQMLMCEKQLTVVVKNLKTGRKSIPTCIHVTPSHVLIGTECGSIQCYKYPWTFNQLRPQQSTNVDSSSSSSKASISSIVTSVDASLVAARTSQHIYVYKVRGLVKSSIPILQVKVTVDGIREGHSTPTMAFSPSGKVLVVGDATLGEDDNGNKPKLQSKLDIYALENHKNAPIYSLDLNTRHPIVGISWHFKLNQILVATTDAFQIWYSDQYSKKGALLTSGRKHKPRDRGEDALQDLYSSRAPPPGSTIRQEEILAPNALPLFGGEDRRKKKRQRQEEEDFKNSKIPQKPSKDIYGTGNSLFAQMVMDTQTATKSQIAGKDPREALAKYSEGKSYIGTAYEGNKERILAEHTVEQEEDEMKQKSRK